MPIPLVAIPLIKAAVDLALFGTLAEIAAFSLPVIVGGAAIAGAAYYYINKKEVEKLRHRALLNHAFLNPGSSRYKIWLRGYKSYNNEKRQFTQGHLPISHKYSIFPYTEQWGGYQHIIYYEKVIRDGNKDDFFFFDQPGQTSGYSDSNAGFHPGTVSLTYLELENWDSLTSERKSSILNTLKDSDWNSIIQSISPSGILKPGDFLQNSILTGDSNSDNSNLKIPSRLSKLAIGEKVRLPADFIIQTTSELPKDIITIPPDTLVIKPIPEILSNFSPPLKNTPEDEMPPFADSETKKHLDILNAKLDSMLPFFPALLAKNNPLDIEQTISATKEGVCRSTNPGGCMNKALDSTADNIKGNSNKNTGNILDAYNAGSNTTQLALLQTINTKLGAELANGGISGFLTNFLARFNKVASWLHLDRALNVLIWWQTLHNAYMLSNNLGQTLTSAISNVLSAVGIKDAEGSALDIGDIIGDTVDSIAKKALGETAWGGIKTEWKRYNRIYQASANILNSVQSIGHSVLGALNVVGNWNASIGNALRKWGVVAENAYQWMNPQVNFQNRFFVGLEAATNVVSQIDQVTSEVLSVQDNVKQIGEQSQELQKSLEQSDGSKQAINPAEASKIKQQNDVAKLVSKGQNIADIDKEADE